MAYVPPALRKGNSTSTGTPRDQVGPARSRKDSATSIADKSDLLDIKDIQDHFWPRQEAGNVNPEEHTDAQESTEKSEKGSSFAPVHQHSTLNGTAEAPNQLKYLLLFHGANPRWATDKLIFAKTNLHLLQKSTAKPDTSSTPHAAIAERSTTDQTSATTTTTHIEQNNTDPHREPSSNMNTTTTTTPITLPTGPIYIFEQSRKGHGATFALGGYYTLTNLEILEPKSLSLVRMLEQKWTATNSRGFATARQRDPDSWKRSLNHQWAVLRFEKDEESTAELPPPQIEPSTAKANRPARAQQSVNEMLQELRLKDKKDKAGGGLECGREWT